MPSEDSAQILREMKKIGAEFGKKATALSNVIRHVESTLQEMEGKVEGRQYIDENRILVFGRFNDGWRFWIEDDRDEREFYRMNQINIETKALVGAALPKLVDDIVSTAKDRLSSINEALTALEEIPWLDVEEASKDDEVPF